MKYKVSRMNTIKAFSHCNSPEMLRSQTWNCGICTCVRCAVQWATAPLYFRFLFRHLDYFLVLFLSPRLYTIQRDCVTGVLPMFFHKSVPLSVLIITLQTFWLLFLNHQDIIWWQIANEYTADLCQAPKAHSCSLLPWRFKENTVKERKRWNDDFCSQFQNNFRILHQCRICQILNS